MTPSNQDVQRLMKAVEGAKMVTRLIDERMALKLSKIDNVVHEGVYYAVNVIPLKQISRNDSFKKPNEIETIGATIAVTRSGDFVQFNYCSIETNRGVTWVADAIPLAPERAAFYITAQEFITLIQDRLKDQTDRYKDKIINMRRVSAMLEWLRTGDPTQFNQPKGATC